MASLKDRQRQIPGGFIFSIPEVGYRSTPFASFDTIVNSVDNIVKANPRLAQAGNWPNTRNDIAAWVDGFNARWCLQNGWNDYTTGSPAEEAAAPPKSTPPPTKAAALAAGAKSLAEWMWEGAKPVDPVIATGRARVCAACPRNQPGDMSNFFERATSELIRNQIYMLSGEGLSTQHDSKLGVCDACFCPLRLKVWTPLSNIVNHMSDEVKNDLDPKCWILEENKNQ